MMGMSEQITALLRRLLNETSMTQVDLAQRAGYSEKHVSEILNGRCGFTMEAAERLFGVLGHEPVLTVVPLKLARR